MFDYPLLEVLQTIDREENFERAAQTMGVSKSYISQRLRLLEERMGAKSVSRNTVQATYFGNMLLRHLEDVKLREQTFLKDNASLFAPQNLSPTIVKVAVGHDSLISWFRDVISSAHEDQTEFFVDIILCGLAETKQALCNGEIHAALTASKEPIADFDSNFLGRHVYKATASPDFVKKYFAKGVTQNSVALAPSLQFCETDTQRQQWSTQAFGESHINPTTYLPSSHGILNVCLEGGAWAVNSGLLADKYIENGKLVELILGYDLFSDLYWHVSQNVSSRLANLTQTVVQTAQQHLIQTKTIA